MNIFVVVDLQNDYVSGKMSVDGSKELPSKIAEEIKKHKSDLILFTQDTHTIQNWDLYNEAKHQPIHCVRKTEGWELVEEMKPFINSKNVYSKITYAGSSLIGRIRYKNVKKLGKVDKIYVCGLNTDTNVISTAIILQTYINEAQIIVYKDLCVGTTEEKHNNALKTMEGLGIEVI